MDLTTNGVVVTDAIKYVTQKAEQVSTLQKIDESMEGKGDGRENYQWYILGNYSLKNKNNSFSNISYANS
jgi:hypothetical protein